MNSFKDSMGRFLTYSLFWEFRRENDKPIFTIKSRDIERDGVEYPSLKRFYMSLATFPEDGEYDFATSVFGEDEGWEHWQKLLSNRQLYSDYFSKWREELEIKRRAEAIKELTKASRQGSKGVSAAKYIAEKGWQKRAGRPSKDEINRERKIAAGIHSETMEDIERLKEEGLLN